MTVYAMHYFMGRTITYSDDSSTNVSRNLKRPSLSLWNSNLISHLLNRQVKFAMHKLRVETTEEIFDELEKRLKTRDKAFWATGFSVIIILCICMEEAQVAVNGLAMHKRTHQPKEAPSSEEIVDIYRKLDDYPFRHLTELFHAIFKTQKDPSPTWNDNVYNPIRDGFQADSNGSLRQDAEQLVKEVRRITRDYGTCWLEGRSLF